MDKRWSIKLCQLLLSQACNKRRKIFYPYFNLYIFSNNGFFEKHVYNGLTATKKYDNHSDLRLVKVTALPDPLCKSILTKKQNENETKTNRT